MNRILVKCMKECLITLLTIVVNQRGDLIPDRTDVIRKLTNDLGEVSELLKAMEAK